MKKLILLFGLLVAISVSFNFISCHKSESEGDGYSEWMETTEVDSVIYAKARKAYLDDPANVSSPDFKIIQFLSGKPFAVRTQTVKGKGKNYQFAFPEIVVTVYKGNNDEVGKVIKVEDEEGDDQFIGPVKRDTIFGI